ncbi:MAG TPA: hypothetical protein DEQ84_02540 [Prevotellaceae bacterium]|nr:hypothetical protein [Prevotellaceae bacterium]
MKRFYLIAMAIFSALSISAETSIQNTFFGCTLGKSTSKEVQTAMTAQGFKLLDTHINKKDSIFGVEVFEYNYEGQYNHKGKDFHSLRIGFWNDIFYSVLFKDSCLGICSDYADSVQIVQTNLERKYGSLDMDTITYTKENLEIATRCGMKVWSRQDKSTIVETILVSEGLVSKYKKFVCGYKDRKMSNNILKMQEQTFKRIQRASNPNYSENNKVYGVAGVKFGDDKETVRKIIAPKSEMLLNSDPHMLQYGRTNVGGSTYDGATFYFMQGKLSSVTLQQAFYSWKREEARMFYENIKSQYAMKYSNLEEFKDEYDEKICVCGAFIDGYDYPPIFISFKKALSKGGDMMYYVIVSYYEARMANIYNDEI